MGNGQLPFLVDTGSPIGIVAGPKELASVGIEFGPDSPTQNAIPVGAAGAQEQDIPWVTTTLDAFGTKFDFPVGQLEIIPNAGNIGNAFLSQFVVTFDFPNNTMYLDPISLSSGWWSMHSRWAGMRSWDCGSTPPTWVRPRARLRSSRTGPQSSSLPDPRRWDGGGRSPA